MMFDLNDFDETMPGPWEWDVKRLATSVLIAAAYRGFADKDQDQVVLDTLGAYRKAMREFAEMNSLDVWYSHLDIQDEIKHTPTSSRARLSREPRNRSPRRARRTACRRSPSSPTSSTAR